MRRAIYESATELNAMERLPCEQRLHFRGMRWRAKSSYFSHASSYLENVASARRVWKGENDNEKVNFAFVNKTLLLVHPTNCPLIPVDYFPVSCGSYVYLLVISRSLDSILWYVMFTFYYLILALFFLVFALCLMKLHFSQPILRFKIFCSCLLLWWKTRYIQIIP